MKRRAANGQRRSAWSILRRAALAVGLMLAAALLWLRWDAGQPREQWFAERHGQMQSVAVEGIDAGGNQEASAVSIASDSGLAVDVRVIRGTAAEEPLPVLVVLGGHRTGSAAVELFGDVGDRAVVALDYPYEGSHRVRGFKETLRAIPLIRQAFLDTPPAISLVVDWLEEQPWVDTSRIVMVGASLGVPFAATAAARDDRLSALLLVHGAADNRLWLQENLSSRVDPRFLQPAMATLLHWMVYGPVFETEEHVAAVSPRPVLIVGAREDERTPAGQTEVLYEAAGEPKMLRWTEGQHLGPERSDIIEALLRIADEELRFFDQGISRGSNAVNPGGL